MPKNPFPPDYELPPDDDFSQVPGAKEKVFIYDDEEIPDPPVTEKDRVEAKLAELTKKTPFSPVSAQKKVDLGNPITEGIKDEAYEAVAQAEIAHQDQVLDHALSKLPKKPMTSAERKKAWRERNGEEAKRKEREYLRSYRAKKKASQ